MKVAIATLCRSAEVSEGGGPITLHDVFTAREVSRFPAIVSGYTVVVRLILEPTDPTPYRIVDAEWALVSSAGEPITKSPARIAIGAPPAGEIRETTASLSVNGEQTFLGPGNFRWELRAEGQTLAAAHFGVQLKKARPLA